MFSKYKVGDKVYVTCSIRVTEHAKDTGLVLEHVVTRLNKESLHVACDHVRSELLISKSSNSIKRICSVSNAMCVEGVLPPTDNPPSEKLLQTLESIKVMRQCLKLLASIERRIDAYSLNTMRLLTYSRKGDPMVRYTLTELLRQLKTVDTMVTAVMTERSSLSKT